MSDELVERLRDGCIFNEKHRYGGVNVSAVDDIMDAAAARIESLTAERDALVGRVFTLLSGDADLRATVATLTEIELVEACARAEMNHDERRNEGEAGEEPWLACSTRDRDTYREGVRVVIAALRSALPDGVVLTNTGLAKVTEVEVYWNHGYGENEVYGDGSITPISSAGPLYLLTPLEEA